ncbi:MAG: flavodoxin family protein [archaeon]|nr:MAG: flavodoxin family protein [archaeon]
MKIVAVCGSPRKGNTEFMLRKVLEKAKELGAETELILLREKKIEFCDGCHGCEGGSGKCSISDDMNEIRNKLLKADSIVFGSPIYYDGVTGLLKNFIDRTNPIYGKLRGKKFAFVIVGQLKGEEGELSRKLVVDFLKDISEIHEMELIDYVFGVALKPEEIADDEKTIKELEELGKKIYSE